MPSSPVAAVNERFFVGAGLVPARTGRTINTDGQDGQDEEQAALMSNLRFQSLPILSILSIRVNYFLSQPIGQGQALPLQV
jgi:hypothetical protein